MSPLVTAQDPNSQNAYWAGAAASLAAVLAAPAAAVEPDQPGAEPAPVALPAPPRSLRRAISVLLVVSLAIVILSDPQRLLEHPVLAAVLACSLVALDRLRIDIFDTARVAPGSVMSLLLAFLFGPFGVLVGEALVAADRAARRLNRTRISFDLANQVIAGAAAGATFAALDGPLGTIGAAIAGALANYLVSASLLSFVFSVMAKATLRATWREQVAWLWVHYLACGALAGAVVVLAHSLGVWSAAIFALPIAMLGVAEHKYLSRTRRNVAEQREQNAQLELAGARLQSALDERQLLLERAHTSYLRTITTLARAVQARDPYAAGRCERVTRIAQRLADELGVCEDDRHAIAVGVICADIGKIGIPDRLLHGRGQLSDRDYQILRSYPEISAFILAELDLPQLVTEMARHHLERWDGGGTPDGLAGEDIPLAARILAVADALDHKTAAGPGRPALPLDLALSEFELETGSRFCPTVVGVMRRCLDDDPAMRSYFGGDARAVDSAVSAA